MAVSTSTYQMAQIQMVGTRSESNGATNTFTTSFDYYLGTSGVVSYGNAASVKSSLMSAWTSTVWNSVWQAAVNTIYTPSGLYCRFLDVPSDAFSAGTTPSAATGPSTDPLPSQASVMFLKKTGLRGRSLNNGRWFIPCPSESDTIQSSLSGGGLTAWQALKSPLAAALSVTISGTGYNFVPVMISQINSNMIDAPTTITYAPISSVVLAKTISTLRKRRDKTSNETSPYA